MKLSYYTAYIALAFLNASVILSIEEQEFLPPEIMHELIDEIIVHAPEGSSGNRSQQAVLCKKKGCADQKSAQPFN